MIYYNDVLKGHNFRLPNYHTDSLKSNDSLSCELEINAITFSKNICNVRKVYPKPVW